MANQEHRQTIKQGKEAWNAWRKENPEQIPDLSSTNLSASLFSPDFLTGADLSRVDFHESSLSGLDLTGTDLTAANLTGTDLSKVNLSDAFLSGANLTGTKFTSANLTGADLTQADFFFANLTNANLSNARLGGASLVSTNFERANLTGCHVYGCSVWDVKLAEAIQRDLVITRFDEPRITVDNLEVAQFIYLLLNNEKIRQVIDTITSKVVLILGRFTNERKRVLDAMREELRFHDYLPVLFDFEKPAHRDLTETISTLAHMARFVIADITDTKSIPQELMAIVPFLRNVPVQPLLLATQREYGMFESFRSYPWVLESFLYDNEAMLLTALKEKVIGPAEAKAKELAGR